MRSKSLYVELLFVLMGLIISIVFIYDPRPFWMAAFVFVAQPMFVFAMVSGAIRIYRDLKSREVI